MMSRDWQQVYDTSKGIKVYVQQGNKPGWNWEWDFLVGYGSSEHHVEDPPRHWDFVVDVYRKRAAAPEAFRALVDHLLKIIASALSVVYKGISVPVDLAGDVNRLRDAGIVDGGGLDLELLLVLFDLVQQCEATTGDLGRQEELYRAIRDQPRDVEWVAALTEKHVLNQEELAAELSGLL